MAMPNLPCRPVSSVYGGSLEQQAGESSEREGTASGSRSGFVDVTVGQTPSPSPARKKQYNKRMYYFK
jgi:hypothetical protein